MITYYIKKRESDKYYIQDGQKWYKKCNRQVAYSFLKLLKSIEINHKQPYKDYDVYFKINN